MDPFEHDEDDSDDKDNLPPAHVQDHTTDVKVLMYIVMFIIITNETKSIINQVASDCYFIDAIVTTYLVYCYSLENEPALLYCCRHLFSTSLCTCLYTRDFACLKSIDIM